MNVTFEREFDTLAEANAWLGTIPRNETWTYGRRNIVHNFRWTHCSLQQVDTGEVDGSNDPIIKYHATLTGST